MDSEVLYESIVKDIDERSNPAKLETDIKALYALDMEKWYKLLTEYDYEDL